MATKGTPSGKSLIFEMPRSGGGGSSGYAPSGYAQAYATGQGIMDMIDWQDRKRRGDISERSAISEEERSQQKEADAKIREARMQQKEDRQAQRQQFMEDWRMRQEERSSALDMLKFRSQEAAEKRDLLGKEEQTRAEEAATKFAMLDPNKMSFGYDARNVMTDKSVSSALAGKHGRQVKAILDEKMASHDNIIKHYQSQAEEAGLAGDVRQFADKTGMMDEVKFSNALKSARTVKAEKMEIQRKAEAEAAAKQAAELGLVPESLDPKTKEIKYGRPKTTNELVPTTTEAGSKPVATSTLPKTQTKDTTPASQQPDLVYDIETGTVKPKE